MIKKEKDIIEYCFSKVKNLLSPDRADFDLFIKTNITKGESFSVSIKNPYYSRFSFLNKKILIFKVAPIGFALLLIIIISVPELKNNPNKVADQIIEGIKEDELSLSVIKEENDLFDEIENSNFDDLAKISFYEE